MSTISLNSKEYKTLKSGVKGTLKTDSKSVSFWVNYLVNQSQSGDCRKLILIRLGIDKLPVKKELSKMLTDECLKGFKFYSERDNTVLVCRKSFKKDSNGVVIRENDSAVVEKTWYEKKSTFTFDAMFGAIFNPSKTKVLIPESEIQLTKAEKAEAEKK